jgi:hypothetical protein
MGVSFRVGVYMQEGERKLITLDDLERRHLAEHQAPYFDWIRQVVNLATGSLTVLVALQGSYVPQSPKWRLALLVAWLSLGLCVAAGLFALRWQYRARLVLAADLRQLRVEHGDQRAAALVQAGRRMPVPASHHWAVRAMTAALATAFAALCAFAGVNLLG